MSEISAITTRIYVTWRSLTALGRGERGASLVEYVLLAALIAMVAFAAVALLGEALDEEYGSIASSVARRG